MKMYKVKLRCSCEIRGKAFKAGEVITLKQDRYSQLASQGYIKEVVEELETENFAQKRLGRPPNDKMRKTANTKRKRRKTKTRTTKK